MGVGKFPRQKRGGITGVQISYALIKIKTTPQINNVRCGYYHLFNFPILFLSSIDYYLFIKKVFSKVIMYFKNLKGD